MERTLAELARDGAPLETRLRVAHGLLRAVEALHRRGRVHGALAPAAVLVAGEGDAVALAAPRAAPPLELAGFAPPEVVRGARPSRRADAFAAGALAQLALTGRPPFEGDDPLETVRRVLFEAPRPARLDEPAIPAEADEALSRLLERRPGRRGSLDALAAALEAELARRAAPGPLVAPQPLVPIAAPPQATRGRGTAPSAWRSWISRGLAVARSSLRLAAASSRPALAAAAARLAALPRRLPPSPLHRAALAAAPLLLVALATFPRSDAALASDVASALERGDVGAARARLDAAPRGADRALVEKLRGDVACARRSGGECLRRYRTALAARPALREDPALRRNVRALLGRDVDCATRRSAALLAGELRDREALPALEAARRSGGLFAFLCTGDAVDRAIAATRAAR